MGAQHGGFVRGSLAPSLRSHIAPAGFNSEESQIPHQIDEKNCESGQEGRNQEGEADGELRE